MPTSLRATTPLEPARNRSRRSRPASFPLAGAKSPQRALRRYHFHSPGLLYVVVTLFIAIGAINSQNNLLFAALGLAAGGLLISGLISGGALLGLRVHRSVPANLPLGEPLRVRYTLRNGNRFMPAFGLHIDETVGDRELGGRANWPAYFAQPSAFAIQVPPRAGVEAIATVFPRRRGRLDLGPLMVWTTFPFGLVKKSIALNLPQQTLIHPPILPLRPGLLARLVSRATCGHNADRNPGSGDEFFGLREYRPGDSLRRIAWKRSARTGDLFVRQHAMPSPHRLWIVLRLPPVPPGSAQSLDNARLAERAIALAASLLHAAAHAEIAVGLAIPGLPSAAGGGAPAGSPVAAPRLGRPHVDRLLTELALLEPLSIRSAGFPEAVARGGACVVIDALADSAPGAPPHTVRFSASEAERFLEDTDHVRRTLALLEPPALPAPSSAWSARLRRLLRAAGGSA